MRVPAGMRSVRVSLSGVFGKAKRDPSLPPLRLYQHGAATAFTVWNQSVVNEKVYTVSLVGIAIISWLEIYAVEGGDRSGARVDGMEVLRAFPDPERAGRKGIHAAGRRREIERIGPEGEKKDAREDQARPFVKRGEHCEEQAQRPSEWYELMAP